MQNILVVDDAGIIRFKLKNDLTSAGFNVYEAPNGAVVRDNTFSRDLSFEDMDLILLDIYLKNESGLELLKYIKNRYPYIQVIMISVETKKEVVRKAIDLGAADFLAKPFDKEDMLSRVNRVLSRSKEEVDTAKEVEEKSPGRDEVESLKTALSMEINRSIRAELPVSLAKIDLSENIEAQEMRKVKDTITGRIRDIDRVFFLEKNAYTFLLPLTDEEGSKVFADKIDSCIEENISPEEVAAGWEIVTFPAGVVEGDEIDPQKQNDYRGKMLETIGI